MQFHVSDIRTAHSIEKSEELDPSVLLDKPSTDVSFHHPIKVEAEAKLAPTDILISGHVSTTATFVCARCLKSFEKPLKGKFSQVFDGSQDIIDVNNEIRETVYIDLPLKALCKQECKGICSICGVNKNESTCKCPSKKSDPRWNALQNLKI